MKRLPSKNNLSGGSWQLNSTVRKCNCKLPTRLVITVDTLMIVF